MTGHFLVPDVRTGGIAITQIEVCAQVKVTTAMPARRAEQIGTGPSDAAPML